MPKHKPINSTETARLSDADTGAALAKKLGIKTEGMPIAILWEPDGFGARLGLTEGEYERDLIIGKHDVIIIFTGSRVVLREFFPLAIARLEPNGRIWTAWPKTSEGGKTDLSAETIREIAEMFDMVEVGRCAIEREWNGMKFRKGTIDSSKNASEMEGVAPYSISTAPLPVQSGTENV